ncbi:MAG: hypothetical protein DMD72_11125 [Gemmatimonadetes bacterium]|nr:MAG: hypothetical protein DMD72_11125 [Gemmatimonadota bacterium]PYO78364.1 MAG: hypothetical protein DMD63_07580 [Gemmatimonadota bacterium]
MDCTRVSSNPADQRRLDPYDKPQLKKLGSFRELTRCGSLLDILQGHVSPDDCVFRGSSHFTWHA